MKVLVTGASGFVGRGLCACLDELGHEVGPVFRTEGAKLRVESIDADTDWSAVLATFRPDAVVHCAARVHVVADTHADPIGVFRAVNVEGTRNLAAQAHAFGISRFVFLSSIKVHGELSLPGRPFVETDTPAPVDPYGVSKLEAETALSSLATETGLEVVVVRPPLVYGPGVGANFRSLVRLVGKGVPLPFANVDNRRSYVSLANLCDFIARCLDHPAAAGETFLVSDDHDLSLPDTIRSIARVQGVRVRLLPVPEWLLKVMLASIGRSSVHEKLCGSLQVDPSYAKSRLSWCPPVGIEEGLASVVD